MKPVIKKQSHYNLLIMRDDDTQARTYRVHGRWLRLFFYLLLVLMLGGAAGISGGVHYWKKYRMLSARFDNQEREVSDMRLQLERLVTLETVISASNGTIPQARHAEIGVMPVSNATAPGISANATAAASQSVLAGEKTRNATLLTVNATIGAADKTMSAGNATRTENRAASLPQISGGQSPLRIAGFSCRATGQQRLRISYELSTEFNEEQRMISGMVKYFAVFASGARLELSAYESDGSRFSITRMKLMQSSARLPQGYMAGEVRKVDVQIELSDGSKFEERFDVNEMQ